MSQADAHSLFPREGAGSWVSWVQAREVRLWGAGRDAVLMWALSLWPSFIFSGLVELW